MILSATGHRPDKLGGYVQDNPIRDYVLRAMLAKLRELKPEKCISGMALGVDQWFAECCTYLQIPWIAAVPFIGQESRWPQYSQQNYRRIIKSASEIVVVSQPPFDAIQAMQIRNEWMVDHSDEVLAVFDGSRGGTWNCVHYAKLLSRPIHIINPKMITAVQLHTR